MEVENKFLNCVGSRERRGRGEGGWLARHCTINENGPASWLGMFEHGHRAVCGGGLFEVGSGSPEALFADGLPVNGANTESAGGEQYETVDKRRYCR